MLLSLPLQIDQRVDPQRLLNQLIRYPYRLIQPPVVGQSRAAFIRTFLAIHVEIQKGGVEVRNEEQTKESNDANLQVKLVVFLILIMQIAVQV